MTLSLTAGVRWRAAGATLDAWLPLRPAPEQNGGFTEARQYVFEKPGIGWSLRIDDELLDEDPGNRMHWRWEPGFFAGEVTAELFAPDCSASTVFLFDVAPERP